MILQIETITLKEKYGVLYDTLHKFAANVVKIHQSSKGRTDFFDA